MVRSYKFYLENVFNTLLTKGKVATLRIAKPDSEYVIAKFIRNGKVIQSIKCKVINVINLEPYIKNNKLYELLSQYIDISGFENVNIWLYTAKKLHKAIPKYLIILEKISSL